MYPNPQPARDLFSFEVMSRNRPEMQEDKRVIFNRKIMNRADLTTAPRIDWQL
jgi:hypothetical protein